MTWNIREKLASRLGSLPGGRHARLAGLAGLLLCLLLLPVGMGGNRYVPLIGWGETLVDDYCLSSLRRAQDAYLVTQALDSAIALARSAEASAGIFGVSAALSPGESLSPLHDSVKMLSDFLTYAILLLMVEKQAMGMLSWVCLKLLLPLGLLLLAPGVLAPGRGRRLARAGVLLCKSALTLWLLLPVTAGLGVFVDSRYLAPKYAAHVERVKQEMTAIFNLPGEESAMRGESLGGVALRAIAGLAPQEDKGTIGKFKELFSRVKSVALRPGDLISLLMLLFSQIAITAYVMPAIVLLLFLGIWRILLQNPNAP